MIFELERNILQAKDVLIGHCCNTQNTMGSGVAKALRMRFPEVYTADKSAYIKEGVKLLGRSIIVPVTTRPKETKIVYIANLYGQPNYGYAGKRHVDYEALYQALEEFKAQAISLGCGSVGLPFKLGSDRAGGHWPIVYEMIRHIFGYMTVNLYKYERVKIECS